MVYADHANLVSVLFPPSIPIVDHIGSQLSNRQKENEIVQCLDTGQIWANFLNVNYALEPQ